MEKYHRELNFRPLMPLHMRETLDFVAPHFHMGVPILLATIRTAIGLESHGFHSL
jgi:hypothetical protein